MKVLILSSRASSLVQFRTDMICDIIARGHQVIAAAPEPEIQWSGRLAKLGAGYRSINIDRTGLNPIDDIKGLFSLYKLIKKEKPQVIFSYQAKTVIYGSIAAWMGGVQNINALLAGLGSAFRSTNANNTIIKKVLCLQYRFALSKCKNVFFQNHDDLNEFTKIGLVAKEKVTIINGSGVNLERFSPQPMPDNNVFLFVGRLIRDKGIMEYLEAAKKVKLKYPEAKIMVLGSFDTNPTAIEPEDLQPYVDNGFVEYLGETEDVRPFLKDCSVFVLPSYHEGTPKSVLEAMATRRPIITTDAPGCRETVIDGVNGFLVPVKDVDGLVDKMVWMIEHRSDAEKMAEQSLRICKDKYDVRKVNALLIKTMGL